MFILTPELTKDDNPRDVLPVGSSGTDHPPVLIPRRRIPHFPLHPQSSGRLNQNAHIGRQHLTRHDPGMILSHRLILAYQYQRTQGQDFRSHHAHPTQENVNASPDMALKKTSSPVRVWRDLSPDTAGFRNAQCGASVCHTLTTNRFCC